MRPVERRGYKREERERKTPVGKLYVRCFSLNALSLSPVFSKRKTVKQLKEFASLDRTRLDFSSSNGVGV